MMAALPGTAIKQNGVVSLDDTLLIHDMGSTLALFIDAGRSQGQTLHQNHGAVIASRLFYLSQRTYLCYTDFLCAQLPD